MPEYYVDPKKLAPKGEEFRKSAVKFNSNIVSAYQNLAKMKSTWSGKRYNDLVKECNKLVNGFNSVNEFLVKNVPYLIEYDAEAFAKTDGYSTGVSPRKSTPTQITSLTEGKEQLHLSDENASAEASLQKDINANFNNAGKALESMASIFSSTKSIWKTPSGDSSRSQFEKSKGEIEQSTNKIKTDLDRYLTETIKAFKQNEANRKVDAKNF